MEQNIFNINPENCQPSDCADFSKINTQKNMTVTYTNRYKYIMYWKDFNWLCNDPIYVYDVKNKTEEQHNKTSVLNKFPPPPPFAMWGTPLGHFSQYNIMMVGSKSEYEKYIKA